MTSTLAIDIETYSSTDLKKCGVYRYCEDPDFEILLFGYSLNGGKVQVVDLKQGEQLPADIFDLLTDASCLKTAHNAAFEMACISRHFSLTLDPNQWECTQARVAYLGLPLTLESAAKALGLSDQKMAEGKKLIRYFCVPCNPTKANGMRTRNLPAHDLFRWAEFKEYCAQDVRVEMEIRSATDFFEITPAERRMWVVDHRINAHGVLFDAPFIHNAVTIDDSHTDTLLAEATALTGLDNPNSVSQLRTWLEEEGDEEVATLTKATVKDLLTTVPSETARRVLELRQQLSKTSTRKYKAMQAAMCQDGRIRGMHQYYGANRTGRWSGRIVQPQNLPQNKLPDLDAARRMVVDGDSELLELCFGDVPDTLSQLIRTAIIAPAGSRLLVADFSAIEARVIAWLAGEQWRLDVFNTHGKIYEASAAQMFRVPIDTIAKGRENYALRAKGKIAELALGYQGGPGALEKMGALKMGLEKKELQPLVDMWRTANKAIVKLWYNTDSAAIEAVQSPGERVNVAKGLSFQVLNGILWMGLPSGRKLAYQVPRLQDGKFGPALTYMGMDQTTKRWMRLDTYGGKLVENAVQAIARDLLAEALLRLDAVGYQIVMHVHDEVVCEMPYGEGSGEEMASLMSIQPEWAKGLPLAAEAYETEYYRKD